MVQKGDFGLAQIKGPLGVFISFCQWLTGDASRYTHAFVVIDDDWAVEARPWRSGFVKYRERWPEAVFSHLELTPRDRDNIALHAMTLVNRTYNWLDYLALALAAAHIRPKWLRKYIGDSGHLICSQLVDLAYLNAGVHLFDDGRLPMDVTPGDLLYIGRVW